MNRCVISGMQLRAVAPKNNAVVLGKLVAGCWSSFLSCLVLNTWVAKDDGRSIHAVAGACIACQQLSNKPLLPMSFWPICTNCKSHQHFATQPPQHCV